MPPTHDDFMDLLTRLGALETVLGRAASHVHDLRYAVNRLAWPQHTLDDTDRGHGVPPECRHHYPIGDYCPYCQETGPDK